MPEQRRRDSGQDLRAVQAPGIAQVGETMTHDGGQRILRAASKPRKCPHTVFIPAEGPMPIWYTPFMAESTNPWQQELQASLDCILDSLRTHYHPEEVIVFGSMASGNVTEDSDIDLLVRMEQGRNLLDLVGLWQDLEDLLGRKVDVISEGGVDPYIKDKIESEAVAL